MVAMLIKFSLLRSPRIKEGCVSILPRERLVSDIDVLVRHIFVVVMLKISASQPGQKRQRCTRDPQRGSKPRRWSSIVQQQQPLAQGKGRSSKRVV